MHQLAAEALGKIGDPRAVEPLITDLKDMRYIGGVNASAADALVKIGAPAVEPLIATLKDSDGDVWRVATAYALVKIGRPPWSRSLSRSRIVTKMCAMLPPRRLARSVMREP